MSRIFERLDCRIGLGLAALGRPGYINLGHAEDLERRYDVPEMRAHAHTVLDAAWTAGVRYFDVARSYGRAEEFLASWLAARATLRQAQGERAIVGSKWGYAYTADWQPTAEVHEVKEHSIARFDRQIAESRAILGGHLDLYQIHSATIASGVLENREVLERLAALKRSKIAVGLTVTGAEQAETIRRAITVRVDGERVFDCVQATWNVLEPAAGTALAEAHAAGLGVIVKESLANGRLTARNHSADFSSRRAALEAIAVKHGVTIDAVALAAVLAKPWADVVLSGAATVEQLRSNLAALEIRFEAADREALGRLAESSGEYWSTRSRLPWN